MDITALDPRLAECEIRKVDVVRHRSESGPFSLLGVFFDEGGRLYVRMPLDVAAALRPLL